MDQLEPTCKIMRVQSLLLVSIKSLSMLEICVFLGSSSSLHLFASFYDFTMVFKMLDTVNGRVGHAAVSDGDSTACSFFIALLRSE